MATDFNPADNLTDEARSKGGEATAGKNLTNKMRAKGGHKSRGGGRKSQ